MDSVVSNLPFLFVVVVSTGVQVAIESGETAARYFDAQSMARTKVITCGLQIDPEFVHLSRFHPYLLSITLPVPGAKDSFLHVVCFPVRIDIDQLHRKVGIDAR